MYGVPQQRFDERAFQPLSGVKDLIFARWRIKSVLRWIADAWSKKIAPFSLR